MGNCSNLEHCSLIQWCPSTSGPGPALLWPSRWSLGRLDCLPGELMAGCLGEQQLTGRRVTWSLRGGLQQLAAPCPPRPHVATTRREAEPEGRMLAVEVVHPGCREEKGYNYPKAAQMHAAGARPRGWGRLQQRVSPDQRSGGLCGSTVGRAKTDRSHTVSWRGTVQRLRRTRF